MIVSEVYRATNGGIECPSRTGVDRRRVEIDELSSDERLERRGEAELSAQAGMGLPRPKRLQLYREKVRYRRKRRFRAYPVPRHLEASKKKRGMLSVT